MNAQQQNFEKLFRTELESLRFEIPNNELPIFIPIWIQLMESSSLLEMDCDAKTHTDLLEALVMDKPEFNLFNVSVLINTLTRLSPKQLGISLSQYNGYINRSQSLANQWNEIVLPIRDKLVNKLQTQQALQMPKNGMSVIPGRR
jgi:hypothetical protein